MGRNRTFDEATVVASAAAVFAERGYEGSSMEALLAATGLHRGSLYQAFGSKRGLFLHALQARLADGERAAIDLVLVALLELAPRDEAVRSLLAEALDRPDRATAPDRLGRRLLERGRVHLAGVGPANPDDAKQLRGKGD